MPKHILPIAVLLAITAATAQAADVEEGFQSMFNGKDLTGWEGKAGWWQVEDGAITSESTKEKPCRKCNYLMWRGGQPGDFEMRLQYKIIGGNSGIQFRSREVGDFDTNGYQADLEAGDKWSGALFQHGRGGVALRGNKVTVDADGTRHEEKFAESADLQKKIKKEDWNDYRIVAEGNHVLLEINGVRMAEVTDNDAKKACKKGVIGLQVHPGPPMKVQFRNLRIRILD